MSTMTIDRSILHDLASRYAEVAASPRMDELRELWRGYCAGESTRAPILLDIGLWNAWAKEMFPLASMECVDPFYRAHERALRFQLLHASMRDDTVFEPWYTIQAVHTPPNDAVWGVPYRRDETTRAGDHRSTESAGLNLDAADAIGTAYHLHPVLETEEDLEKLSQPVFVIDEEETERQRAMLEEAFGGGSGRSRALTVHVDRGAFVKGFGADISTAMARLRGLEEMMLDMYERPEWLHRLAAFLRDGVLAHQDSSEAAGDISYAAGFNQAVPYHRDLPDPKPNAYGAKRGELWAFFAAQEFTDVSPAMHEEFLLAYQRPIMEKWAFVSYGCCESLTRKIDMLRSVRNLRRIGVTPYADLASCAEQIGTDYLLSWRPGPTDLVCSRFDEELIRERLADGAATCRRNDNRYDIMLKDVEALAAGPESLRRWVEIARETTEE